MIRSNEEILADIDTTLDQLICNAEAVQAAPAEILEENEVEALQKTQESLLAHLLHMEKLLEEKKQKSNPMAYTNIHEKILEFSRLNAALIKGVASKFSQRGRKKKESPTVKPRIGRNRKTRKVRVKTN